MALPLLPDFERTLAISHGDLEPTALSESHGVACGLLVRQPDSGPLAMLQTLAMLEIVREPGAALSEALLEMHQAASHQLDDQQMRLSLWLPDDETPLERRTAALAQWCNGFLAALGAGGEAQLETLSPDAAEALADLQEIAMAEVQPDGAEGASEDEELAFAEIVEYIRIAVLMLREDLRGPQRSESIH